MECVNELYNVERGEPLDVADLKGCPILKAEVDKVIKEMKTGKASGNDDITTKMVKALDETRLEKITEICNLIYDTG